MDAVRGDVVAQAELMVGAARVGDARAALEHLDGHRVLCAHREGPFGVGAWSELIAGWTEHLIDRPEPGSPWYVGRPLIVTSNDYAVGLYNGDTGVLIATPDGGRVAAFARGGDPILIPPTRLDTVATLHAMTIHRGQGSQFHRVTVVLPPADSPLLTRELLYTAVTRARSTIRIIGTQAAVRAAVVRQVRRASGLRQPAVPDRRLGRAHRCRCRSCVTQVSRVSNAEAGTDPARAGCLNERRPPGRAPAPGRLHSRPQELLCPSSIPRTLQRTRRHHRRGRPQPSTSASPSRTRTGSRPSRSSPSRS